VTQADPTHSTSNDTQLPFSTAQGRPARVFGVDYNVYDDPYGGTLYVTKYGMPLLNRIKPNQWYFSKRYLKFGERTATGTGTVYRLNLEDHPRHPLNLVVKFSRFAQDVSLDIRCTFSNAIDPEAVDRARFLDPFHEFSLLRDLRRGSYGPPELKIRTKRPLAIYRAPESEPLWRLGRKVSQFDRWQREILADQAKAPEPVQLDIDHTYVLLFHWVNGIDLHDAGTRPDRCE